MNIFTLFCLESNVNDCICFLLRVPIFSGKGGLLDVFLGRFPPRKPGKGGVFFYWQWITNTRDRGYIFFPRYGVQVMGNEHRYVCPLIGGGGGTGGSYGTCLREGHRGIIRLISKGWVTEVPSNFHQNFDSQQTHTTQ